MSTLTLTLTESSSYLISGIPEYITFSTSSPATVFYTLDGTAPGSSSSMAAGNIYLPTDGTIITVKAYAVSGSVQSGVLSKEYYTDQSGVTKTRLVDNEGIGVLPHGSSTVDSLSVDSSGDSAQETAISFQELDLKASYTDSNGEEISGTSIGFVNKPTNSPQGDYTDVSYVNDNDEFDPNAKVIIIDGTTQSKINSQSVRMINKTYNTMNPLKKDKDDWYNDHLKQQSTVSGNLVRQVYNQKTGYVTFYYYESRDSRWIISKQKVDKSDFSINFPAGSSPFVFKWINDRAMGKIF